MEAQQKEVKKVLKAQTYVDRVTCRKNGSVEVRRSYFYTLGWSASKLAEKVKAVLPAGWKVTDERNEWRAWPKTSYFMVKVEKREAS